MKVIWGPDTVLKQKSFRNICENTLDFEYHFLKLQCYSFMLLSKLPKIVKTFFFHCSEIGRLVKKTKTNKSSRFIYAQSIKLLVSGY